MSTDFTHWQPQACRLCRRPLAVLQRMQGDVCRRLDCQRLAARERALVQRDAALEARRVSAARRWQATEVAEVPVLWLDRHTTRCVPLSADARRNQWAHLQSLAAEVQAAPGPPAVAAPATEDGGSAPLAGLLCAFCSGRCCRYGAGRHAFITADLMRRWLARHPGQTAADAAAAYFDKLPRQHVEHSCVHHGNHGCTLPAEMRSDICNRYACDALRALEAAGQQPALLAAMQRDATLGDAALLRADGFRRLPRQRLKAAAR